MARRYTKDDILDYLDNCVNHGAFFMDLGHGYFYLANSRLSLFANDIYWAIVFEKSGYVPRCWQIQLELNYFGNSLYNLSVGGLYNHLTYNAKHFPLVPWKSLKEIKDADEYVDVSPTATRVRVRSRYVPLPKTKKGYERWVPGICTRKYPEPETVAFEDVARYIAFRYAALCRATDRELRTCLPHDPRQPLPFIMHIDQWHHREYSNYPGTGDDGPFGERPSSYETFPMIADVLLTGDKKRWRPRLKPTNHWSNWPQSGSL